MNKRARTDEILVELDDRHIPVQIMMNEVERRIYQAALQEALYGIINFFKTPPGEELEYSPFIFQESVFVQPI